MKIKKRAKLSMSKLTIIMISWNSNPSQGTFYIFPFTTHTCKILGAQFTSFYCFFLEFSEEEENLRDRIRELETRNKELEKLAAVAKEERRTYNYGM